MPHAISYFDSQTSSRSHVDTDHKILSLLVDYLVSNKHILSSDLVEELKTARLASTDLFETFTKIKDLSQLVRFFADKKLFTGLKLATNLEKLLVASMSRDSNKRTDFAELAHAFLLVPIIFRSSRALADLVDKQAIVLVGEMIASLDSSGDTSANEFESRSFVFSLSQWSAMMLNQSTSRLDDSVRILARANEKPEYEAGVRHILRALNYNLVDLDESNFELKSRLNVGDSLQVIKSHLSSPFHDTRLNTLNILASYFKPDTVRIEPIKLDGDEELDLFEIATRAELTSASLENYRKKIFYLQRLDTNVCSKYFQIEELKDVKIYLLKNLYFNSY